MNDDELDNLQLPRPLIGEQQFRRETLQLLISIEGILRGIWRDVEVLKR